MKKLCCLFLLWIVVCLPARALELRASDQRLDLTPAVEYLEDPSGTLGAADLERPEIAARWRRWTSALGTPNFGYSASAFWLRVCLERAPDAPVDWRIEIPNAKLNELEFHAPDQAPVRTGASLPLSSRSIPSPYFVFPLELRAESGCFLLRAAGQDVLALPLVAWQPDVFVSEQQRTLLLHSLYHGGLLALMVYNLLLSLSLRDRRFLFYSCYVAAISLGIFAGNGFGRLFLWPDWPEFDAIAQAVFLSLSGAGSVLFARDFLRTRTEQPRLDPWLLGSALGFLGVALLLLAQLVLHRELRLLHEFNALNALLMCVLGTIASLQVARSGGRGAKLFLLAWGTLWLGVLVASLRVLGWFPSNMFTAYSIQIAAGLELMLMSLALAEMIRFERERALEFHAQALDSQRQAHELDAQLMASRQLARDKSDFLARVSHELRTPLNAIIGYSRMLRRGSDRITLQEGTADIERSGMRLLAMIEELLDQSHLDAGGMRLQPRPLSLRPWLDEIARAGRLMCEATGNRFELVYRGPDAPVVEADGQRLRQVLDNLLNNANRHTRDGRIELSCAADPDPAAVGLRLAFAVSDSGEGISPRDLSRIFEPFYMGGAVQPARVARAKRIGLGLSISRDLVRLMGGELSVQSQLGQGSCFRFGIECALAADPLPARDATLPLPDLPPALLRRRGDLRLLLVDDDVASRLSQVDLLESLGFVVEAVASLAELVESMRASTLRWDAVITDQQMPDGDGWSVLDFVRQQAPSVPVVLLSATGSQRPAERGDAFDFDACLCKPVEPLVLLEVLAALLPGLHHKASSGRAPAAALLDAEVLRTFAELVGAGAVSDIEDWLDALEPRPELDDFIHAVREAVRRLDLDALKGLVGALQR